MKGMHGWIINFIQKNLYMKKKYITDVDII